RLTDRLLRSRPGYSDPAGGDWPGIFEDVLGAPVVLRSYGPTATAKRGLQSVTALPRWGQEHVQVDGVGHGLVPGVVGVQVITGVVGGVEPERVGGVAYHRVEVDDAVEGAAGADPGVPRLADGLARWRVIAGALVRQQGRAEYPHVPGVSRGDQAPVSGDDLGRGEPGVQVPGA